MDSQGMAMFKMQGDRVEELTVSDPSRKLNRIIVTVSGIYESRGMVLSHIPIRAKETRSSWWICHRESMRAKA